MCIYRYTVNLGLLNKFVLMTEILKLFKEAFIWFLFLINRFMLRKYDVLVRKIRGTYHATANKCTGYKNKKSRDTLFSTLFIILVQFNIGYFEGTGIHHLRRIDGPNGAEIPPSIS